MATVATYEPADEPGSVSEGDGPLLSRDPLNYLAVYASGLNVPGRAEIREALPVAQRATFDLFLAAHDAREDAEGGKARQLRAEEQYLRMRAVEDAKRRRAEEDAEERGHVSSRILSYAELRALPRPVPLIRNVAYSGAVCVLLGDSQTGKTWVLLSIAAAAAHGMHWPVVPQDYTIRPPEPFPVLYVAAEDGGSIGARLECWERAHDRDLTAVRFDSHPHAINLLDDVQIEELCEAVKANGYRLVIFDTVAASLGGEEEGNPQFSKMVQNMRKVVAAMNGEGSVFLAHHFGKDKSKGARGGSSLFNDADIVWELTGTLDLMAMTCKKWKADSIRAPWHLQLDRNDKDAVHIAATSAPASGSVNVLTDPHTIMEDHILKAVEEFAKENQGYGPSGRTISGYLRKKNVQFRETNFRDSLAIMVSDGRLLKRKGPRNTDFYRFPPVQNELEDS